MNRRSFIQSLAAVFCLPAMPLTSLSHAAAGIPAAVDVPARVKSWAVYMSNLHGECTPLTLQRLLHIPEADAKSYVGRLIADGVLKPNPLLQQSLRKFADTEQGDLLHTGKERLEIAEEVPSTDMHASQEEARGRRRGGVANPPEEHDEADQELPVAGGSTDNAEEAVPPQYPSSSPFMT